VREARQESYESRKIKISDFLFFRGSFNPRFPKKDESSLGGFFFSEMRDRKLAIMSKNGG